MNTPQHFLARIGNAEPAPMRRRAALGAAAALLCLAALPACAAGARTRAEPVDVAIVDRDSGQPLAVYRKDGRAYVAGQPAARYAIRLANRTGGRVMVVLSVDGINVISGQTAAFGQTGYVLDPWQGYDITGWRKSDTAVAAFEFAALAESYAERTGRPDNVGVIGAAVFLERLAPQALAPMPSPDTAADASGAAPAPLQRREAATAPVAPPATDSSARAATAGALASGNERLGTAHGQREWSASERTTFERMSSRPQQVVEIAYDSWPRLVAAGVIGRPPAQARAFPNDDPRGYVPDPPPR